MHRWLVLSLMVTAPAAASAQTREALVVFKDGFSIKGKIIQKTDTIYDPATGQSFTIPKGGGFLYMDDDVRRIHFSPNQVHEAIPSKLGETRKDLIRITKGAQIKTRRDYIHPSWVFEKISPWNDRWERTITLNTGAKRLDITQRIILLTPWQTHLMIVQYDMDQQFLTKELGPDFILGLLTKYYGDQKEMKEVDKRLNIARFMHQAGWYGVALDQLEKLVKDHSEAKDAAEPLIRQLKELRVGMFIEDLERSHRAGQHEQAEKAITFFFQEKMAELAGEKQQIAVQDLKTKYASAKENIERVKRYLKELPGKTEPANRPMWTIAAATILEELTIDTLPRLETFLTFAQQHLRELEAKAAKPSQSAEEVMALAISGWLQGNALAEPDVRSATSLFRTRLMLQEYLKTDGSAARAALAVTTNREHTLPIEVIARLIRLMPPITPYDKIGRDQLKLDIEIADAAGGSYLVQLPPDYHHQRAYPTLVLLQSSRDKAQDLIERWKPLAAHHGYILAAPLWVGKAQATYKYTAQEHALVLDCLRDLRRRFNVDTDRTFLFGWEDGGSMAFDIGLSHPHEFAGVLPMNGSTARYPTRYWTNGQYLPFYVVDGDGNGNTPGGTRSLFKKWIGAHYPSIYVEYKGRGSEWYGWELPNMFEWMNKKKRHLSARELGIYHTAGGSGEEFKSLRESDNKFYWLEAGRIEEKNLSDAIDVKDITRPATMQAIIALGNETDAKGARIWNQINLRTSGVKQLSIWLAPHMIDFAKPVTVRVNGVHQGSQKVVNPSVPTMLEEFYHSGDKLRLYYAKIELKL